MQGLSFGVVRVDSENSLTSLTLQDCGQVMPGGESHVHRTSKLYCTILLEMDAIKYVNDKGTLQELRSQKSLAYLVNNEFLSLVARLIHLPKSPNINGLWGMGLWNLFLFV